MNPDKGTCTITGINTDGITKAPKESAQYIVPFVLSNMPDEEWRDLFEEVKLETSTSVNQTYPVRGMGFKFDGQTRQAWLLVTLDHDVFFADKFGPTKTEVLLSHLQTIVTKTNDRYRNQKAKEHQEIQELKDALSNSKF